MNKDNILEVRHVHKRFTSKNVTVKAVTDVARRLLGAVSFVRTMPPRARCGTELLREKNLIF